MLLGAVVLGIAAPIGAYGQPLPAQQREAVAADSQARQDAAGYLREALAALDQRRRAAAGEALERAETRLLSQRAPEPEIYRAPRRSRSSRRNFIGHIASARDLLRAGDVSAARAQTAAALSLLEERRRR